LADIGGGNLIATFLINYRLIKKRPLCSLSF